MLLSGPQTRAVATRAAGEEVTLASIGPEVALGLLRIRLSELTDRVVALDEVHPRLARELALYHESGRLAELVRSAPGEGIDPRFVAASHALTRGMRVACVASAVGLGERQLERLFAEHAGLSPKTFAMIPFVPPSAL